MRFVIFCHSLRSDWNHGNAHFLRGIASELQARGHEVAAYEPGDAWSVANLLETSGAPAIEDFHRAYPALVATVYDSDRFDLDRALDQADVVLVHEWNDPALIERIGRHHARGGRYVLLFHDTHHRSVTAPQEMASYDLEHYDGVLAFGDVMREGYLARGWARRAWTWHEAADVRVFRPEGLHARRDNGRDGGNGGNGGVHHGGTETIDLVDRGGSVDPNTGKAPGDAPTHPKDLRASVVNPSVPSVAGDLVWIGNWGDEERSQEIRRFLIEPASALQLTACVYGVRYPPEALSALAMAGITYGGWLPNYRVPSVFGRYRLTVHIPRAPYVRALPGIPTIRVFEALACGIPLISCWWEDREGLFAPGEDYVVVRTPREMTRALRDLLGEPARARAIAEHGRRTVLARHTCAHRVDALLAIVSELAGTATKSVLMA